MFAWGYVRELQESEEYWRETCEKMIAGAVVAIDAGQNEIRDAALNESRGTSGKLA